MTSSELRTLINEWNKKGLTEDERVQRIIELGEAERFINDIKFRDMARIGEFGFVRLIIENGNQDYMKKIIENPRERKWFDISEYTVEKMIEALDTDYKKDLALSLQKRKKFRIECSNAIIIASTGDPEFIRSFIEDPEKRRQIGTIKDFERYQELEESRKQTAENEKTLIGIFERRLANAQDEERRKKVEQDYREGLAFFRETHKPGRVVINSDNMRYLLEQLLYLTNDSGYLMGILNSNERIDELGLSDEDVQRLGDDLALENNISLTSVAQATFGGENPLRGEEYEQGVRVIEQGLDKIEPEKKEKTLE